MINIDPTIKEWLFAREVMRRLGFAPGEIYFDVFEKGQVVNKANEIVHDFGCPLIEVRVQRGERVFRWMIGPVPMTPADLRVAYDAAVKAWNDGAVDPAEFAMSCARRDAVAVMAALQEKGFAINSLGLVTP